MYGDLITLVGTAADESDQVTILEKEKEKERRRSGG